ncbi:entericidin [Rubrivivax gelatinosus]|uniref:Entericidin n=1 Tax=Rubrivivax gelatinosus TaxID=28068 RepID=A0ABS1DY56_RUBGE|nr:entericidin A/B family lipoprotein [Rubrivivax gelatinosus]MBK1616027.1 entericidin [Rubrivivax gelatinosus]MBK1715017.1 entericidin [Rubrivivax gelatinosus]
MKRSFAALLACLAVFVLGGCNTVKGVGQDIQKAGEVIEHAAKK